MEKGTAQLHTQPLDIQRRRSRSLSLLTGAWVRSSEEFLNWPPSSLCKTQLACPIQEGWLLSS